MSCVGDGDLVSSLVRTIYQNLSLFNNCWLLMLCKSLLPSSFRTFFVKKKNLIYTGKVTFFLNLKACVTAGFAQLLLHRTGDEIEQCKHNGVCLHVHSLLHKLYLTCTPCWNSLSKHLF